METLNVFFSNLSERFSQLTQAQKVMALALIAAAGGSIIAMSFWFRSPDYQLLYANLSPADASAIVEQLKSEKVPYELSNQGKTVRVPSDKVYEIRLQMASEGLPEGSDVGLEVFDKSALGMTEFVQKLNYQRALQGELARTIKTLDAVDQARIHLVIPKETLFIRDKPKGKASVTLKIKPGKNLSPGQIQGIVHLISASVEGINAADVVILDLKGNLLSGDSQSSEGALLTSNNHQHKQRVEKEMERKILTILEEALGKGKVIAKVSATLDFEKVVRTEEIYDPDSQVVRSQQTITEATVGSVPPGGIPGVQSLVPGGQGQENVAGQASKRDKSNLTQNFEINKVVRHVTKPVGEIDKLSVAVLIDGLMAGDPAAYQARSPEDMAKYLQIVQSAVGFNPDRGDQVKVENIQFDRSILEEEAQRIEQEGWIDLGFQGAKYLFGFIFIILFFTRIVRPMVNWVTTSVEVVHEEEVIDPETLALEEEKMRIGQMANENAKMRDAVAEFVATDPKFTAGILRKWMKDKEK